MRELIKNILNNFFNSEKNVELFWKSYQRPAKSHLKMTGLKIF